MSGGQQQRVALARALVNRPRALLLDEPLGALDLKLRQQMQVELKRIQREVGITFVYVTHDQGEALTMSDRIAVMNDGRIEQLGIAAGDLRAAGHPVRGRLHRHVELCSTAASSASTDGVAVLGLRRGRAGAGAGAGDGIGAGDDLELSVRPEKIDLHRTAGPRPATAACSPAWSPRSSTTAPRPTTPWRTVGRPDFVVFDQNASNAEDLAGRGDRVFLTWSPQHSYPIGV